jgi:hypothetical protein
MKFYLMTYHGTFVGNRETSDTVDQIGWSDVKNWNRIANFDADETTFRLTYSDFIGDSRPPLGDVEIDGVGICTLHRVGHDLISISQDGEFLSATEYGTIESRVEAKAWEHFFPICERDIEALNVVFGNEWVVKSSGVRIAGKEIELVRGPGLQFFNEVVPLAATLRMEQKYAPFRLVILYSGWRIDEIILFKPLIFYVAYGDECVVGQLVPSLISLLSIGHYSGNILIFTDKSKAEVMSMVPGCNGSALDVVDIGARDWVGYVAGKYCILDWDRAYEYQPLAYMDPDIIFNAIVDPMLARMAVSDRLTAPLEDYSKLSSSPAVGATLLQLDNVQPRYGCGFNGGTIGIPNLLIHGATVRLMRDNIQNFLSINGRSAFKWVDQEMANYVGYKLGCVDTNEVSRFVRFGNEQSADKLGPLTGLVHFWDVPRSQRERVMRKYLDLLLEHEEKEK